jgi:Uma2 family endonuclease
MNSLSENYVSPEDYLAQERVAETKSEYYDGQVLAMSGGSPERSPVAGNILAALHPQLRRGPCRVYTSDLRVASASGRRYFYPDVTVICGPVEFHDEHRDNATNPKIVFEVVSKTSAAYETAKKFFAYQAIPGLQEYVRVYQFGPVHEHYVRSSNDTWIYQKVEGLAAILKLPTIECSLSLEDIYLSVFQA